MAGLLSPQAPSAMVVVRPHAFTPNPQTASDNAFQRQAPGADRSDVAQRAFAEVTQPDRARRHAIRTRLEDTGRALIDLRTDQIEAFAGNALEINTARLSAA